uniref:Arylacetamide deacetylase like 2 n=1 Tax=Neovison vison TaxID=452646 RepID=A0A8C7B1P9_NEOVI
KGKLVGGTTPVTVQNDLEFKHKVKIQALIYPSLQILDFYLPSHQEYEHGIILTRDLALKLMSLYFTEDETLPQAMRRNEHMPLESRHLFKFVNWSTLLPEKFRKDCLYSWKIQLFIARTYGYQSFTLNLYSCQYDLVRDDGLMYVSRLQNVGVQVTHDHTENGIHAALSLMASPLYLQLGLRMRDMYISWLVKNL